MKLKDLAIDHDYYCSDNNYYSNDASMDFEDFDEFMMEFENADVDMNLVFRWDIHEEQDNYRLEIFMIQQRKGIFKPINVKTITEDDVPRLIEYLKPHLKKLKSLWRPLK